MGKLVYATNISLDGYFADREGKFDWAVPSRDMLETYNDLIRPVGTYLYGRRLYDSMKVWDTAHVTPDSEPYVPGMRDLELEFADLWRAADKVVFSTTLDAVSTPRTRLERSVDPAKIRALVASSDRDVTVGGANLAATMLAEKLVDEIDVFVYPIIVGGGSPWLPADLRASLVPISQRSYGDVVRLRYRCRW